MLSGLGSGFGSRSSRGYYGQGYPNQGYPNQGYPKSELLKSRSIPADGSFSRRGVGMPEVRYLCAGRV